MNEKKVKVEKGEIVLIKPKAGVRNNAALASYENGTVNEVKFMIEIVPKCIKSHPFGTEPLTQSLANLEIEEYDKIVKIIREWIVPIKGDVVKK